MKIYYCPFLQTFGVLTVRMDIHDSTGFNVSRPSASTMTQSETASRSVSSLSVAKVGAMAPDCGQEVYKKLKSSISNAQQSLKLYPQVEVHNLLIIDQHTFEVLHSHQLMQMEYAMSLISCQLGDDQNTYFVVGTALVNAEESDPKFGRILIFQWTDNKLTTVSEKEIKGNTV